jgi:hypothetical protein
MHVYTGSMHSQTLHKRPSLLARGDLVSGPKCKQTLLKTEEIGSYTRLY